MDTRDIFAKAVRRAKVNGVEEYDRHGVIAFLEKEIDRYREKIKYFEECNKHLRKALIDRENETTTLEAVQDNTAGEIIKALAENGYDTITINCYKTEREE